MRQNAFGGRAPPGPAWASLSAPLETLAAIGGRVPTSKGEGWKWEKGRKGIGRGREKGKGREGREGRLEAHTIFRP